jgi:hypothetical protein
MQQLRQRVIASYHLGPLDDSETQGYIEHRLRHVGWSDDPKFDPACFLPIHQATGGIPRRINTLCNRLLLAAFLSESHELNAGDVHAIVDELKEELGPDVPLASVSMPTGGPRVDRLSPRSDAASLHMHFDHIEERIERLEKTVAAAVDLLHRLLHPEKATKPANPGSQR